MTSMLRKFAGHICTLDVCCVCVAGIMYSMGALGPAAGFLVGAAFLGIYVHPEDTPLDMTSSHPAWIGAWWIGKTSTSQG